MEVIFVLVEPIVPENVGAAARALKTMGYGQLRLVNPCEYKSGPATWLAHGSADILDSAKVFPAFKDAISDADFIIGTSAKQRIVKHDYYPASQLPSLLSEKGTSISKIAIVFGREDSGLRNEELEMCDIVTTIPLQTTFPSLNLAQAVMVYAYELSKMAYTNTSEISVNTESLQSLKQKSAALLADLGFKKNSAIFSRMLERLMFLRQKDIQLMHSICNKFFEKQK